MEKIKGLSRVDSISKRPNSSMHGWYVRVYRNNTTFAKFFSDKKYGGPEAAKKAALEHLKKLQEEVDRKYPRKHNARSLRIRPQSNNSSGVSGVHKTEYYSSSRQVWVRAWVATWNENGRRRSKAFYYRKPEDRGYSENGESRSMRTEEEAKKLAIEYRAYIVEKLVGDKRKALAYERALVKKMRGEEKNGAARSTRTSRKRHPETSWVPGLTIRKWDAPNPEDLQTDRVIAKREKFTPARIAALKKVLGPAASLYDWSNIDYEFGRGIFENDILSRCFWDKHGRRTDVIALSGEEIYIYQHMKPDPYYWETKGETPTTESRTRQYLTM
ncbi:MAG: hypothetical protein D6681_03255 [Calditrichaeota bacterium]|nr:MAG: hypothetical protein D6681_03255 [Calditrichota bacterium]